jgi:nicotinamidase-related amidase
MKKALIIIGVQKEYQEGGNLTIKGFDKVAKNISKLLFRARKRSIDILHVRHISNIWNDEYFRAGTPGVDFASGFEPLNNELVFTKSLPSSFSAPLFSETLIRGQYDNLIICGFSSFMCCDLTSREALHKGYKCTFVEDAIGEFSIGIFTEDELHKYACAEQSVMSASIVKTKDVLTEME